MRQKLNYNLDWGKYFRLDIESSSGLLRIRDYRGKSIEGYEAGHKNFKNNGDAIGWRVNFREKSYLVHRIIWVLVHGSIDKELCIDHIDGNPFNNRMNNLSLKTSSGNSMNRRQQSNNTSGVTGVRLTSNRSGNLYYAAQWYNSNGKLKRKYFSIDKLGEPVAKSLAISYRKEQIQRLISEGADYTERHGT